MSPTQPITLGFKLRAFCTIIAVMRLKLRNVSIDADAFQDAAVMRWFTQFAAVDGCGDDAAF
ncbi:hypothetical protein R6Q59_001620 [Mikania micrantha]